MLAGEWMTAVRAEDPAIKEADAILAYPLADRIYQSRAGDTRFTGPDRHRKVAAWILGNQGIAVRLRRFVNRKPWARATALDRQIGSLQLERSLIAYL